MSTAPDLVALLQVAFAEEIDRVSSLALNSNAVCRHFYENLRNNFERKLAASPIPAAKVEGGEPTDEQIARLARQHINWSEYDGEIEFARAVLALRPEQGSSGGDALEAAKPVAWMNPKANFAPDAFIWTRDERNHPEYSVPVAAMKSQGADHG